MENITVDVNVKDMDFVKELAALFAEMRDDNAIPVMYQVRLGVILDKYDAD